MKTLRVFKNIFYYATIAALTLAAIVGILAVPGGPNAVIIHPFALLFTLFLGALLTLHPKRFWKVIGYLATLAIIISNTSTALRLVIGMTMYPAPATNVEYANYVVGYINAGLTFLAFGLYVVTSILLIVINVKTNKAKQVEEDPIEVKAKEVLKWKELLKEEIITEEEYQAKRDEILHLAKEEVEEKEE